MKIEKATIEDAGKLTELTIRSKSHWNYSKEQLQEWKEELTISAEYIDRNLVYKLIENENLVGYYSIIILNQEDLNLDNLFVDPGHLGMGYGTKLMEDALDRYRKLGYGRMVLDSDPNSIGFYTKLGFNIIGKRETSIEGRYLPIMELRF